MKVCASDAHVVKQTCRKLTRASRSALQTMIIIGAMSTDRVIGSGDGMPWDVPEEYSRTSCG